MTMATVSNSRLVFNSVPDGYPVLGETLVYDDKPVINLEDPALLQPGSALVKAIALSLDPYMRGRMHHPDFKSTSYVQPFAIGEPISGFGIAEVIKSQATDLNVGDRLYGFFNFENYSVIQPGPQYIKIKNEEELNWSLYVGVLGMPGKTAYYGYKEFIQTHAKTGDTLFVTTGAGPVGATVIQLAKADGLKVIASAGSDDKVAFMKSIGTDVAFNYKTTDTRKILEEHGPINFYWDHVGGETLEATFENMATHGRAIICGQASDYNTKGEKYGIKTVGNILTRQLTVHGLIQFTYESKYVLQFYAEMPPLVKDGKIKYLEHRTQGLKNGDKAMLDILTGANFGKAVIIL